MPGGTSRSQLNSPFSTFRSQARGMRKPWVMASMTGGHFLMVSNSSPAVGLNALPGIALNHSGSPRTAGTGRGRMASSSGGQRKTILSAFARSVRASFSGSVSIAVSLSWGVGRLERSTAASSVLRAHTRLAAALQIERCQCAGSTIKKTPGGCPAGGSSAQTLVTRSGEDVPVGASREAHDVLVLDLVVAGRPRQAGGCRKEGSRPGEGGLKLLVHRLEADVERRRDVPLCARADLPDREVRVAVSHDAVDGAGGRAGARRNGNPGRADRPGAHRGGNQGSGRCVVIHFDPGAPHRGLKVRGPQV